MAKVPEYYSVGDRGNITIEKLLVILEDIYKDLAVAINKKPDLFIRTTDGKSTDTTLSNGSININSTSNKVEMLTAHPSSTVVTWTPLS